MRRVIKHPLAESDLLEIWFYTFDRWNEPQADRYLREIAAAIERLVSNPGLGADYGHVRAGMRRYAVGRHRIFYQSDGVCLEIIRVLHERMDVSEQLADNDQPPT